MTKQMALYRKYRPSGFDGLVGQEHIKVTLENAIKNNLVSHAYVFTGPRGTGKTSTAKLFAKALNCENPNGVNPCGQCHSCTNDASDILEIDAASNNSVDDIRQLRENIMLAPMYGKYKIYILDEAHMLTTQAFNAFLTTLEEPPSHVRFILATTEVHKIPATILSRCQRFDFRRISNRNIVDRLTYILNAEGRKADVEALELIAQVSAGGMRDAISLLDQSLSRKDNTTDTVTLDDVLSLTGSVDVRVIGKLISLIAEGNIEGALNHFNQCFENGKEPKFFVEEMLIYLRDILVFKKLGANATLKKGSTDTNFQTIANAVSVDNIYVYLDELQRSLSEMKFHHDLQLLIEMTIIRMINNERSSLQAQIDELRQMISSGKITIEQSQANVESVVNTPAVSNEPLTLNNNISDEIPLTVAANEETIEIPAFTLPTTDDIKSTVDETVPTSGHEISVPEFSFDGIQNNEQQLNIPAFSPDVSASQPVVEEKSPEKEIDDPINFINQATEQYAKGIDWVSSMPPEHVNENEQSPSNVELVEHTVEQSHNEDEPYMYAEPPADYLSEEINNESNSVPDFSFVFPTDESSTPSVEEEVSENNTNLPSEMPQSNVPSGNQSFEAGEVPSNTTIILDDVEKMVLGLLQTAHKSHREELDKIMESVLFELGNCNITSKRIFSNFAIKAVNDTHVVLVHSDKIQVKLINKLSHKKNIAETFENVYKQMEYVAITEEQWKAVVAVYNASKQ